MTLALVLLAAVAALAVGIYLVRRAEVRYGAKLEAWAASVAPRGPDLSAALANKMDRLVGLVDPASPPADWLRRATFSRLILHTTDDRSISGLVVEVTDAGVLLRSAVLLGQPDDVPLAGEIWLPRSQVAFAQTVPDTK